MDITTAASLPIIFKDGTHLQAPKSDTGRKNRVVPRKKDKKNNRLCVSVGFSPAAAKASRKGGHRLSPVNKPITRGTSAGCRRAICVSRACSDLPAQGAADCESPYQKRYNVPACQDTKLKNLSYILLPFLSAYAAIRYC